MQGRNRLLSIEHFSISRNLSINVYIKEMNPVESEFEHQANSILFRIFWAFLKVCRSQNDTLLRMCFHGKFLCFDL